MSLHLPSPLVLSPMAGMTDTAFRRLVKRIGGCGLVVSEMVSSEAIIRGIGRSLEYAEYTDEERPVSIQIFGGEPDHMAQAARIIERRGADIIDINMGCPVPKISKHHAGCSLMKEPEHAARIVAAMVAAVSIPVTVKMRAGWDEQHVNAVELARMVEGAGAAAVAVHGRTAAQQYHGHADWDIIGDVAQAVTIPVYGCGDLLDPGQIVERLQAYPIAGVYVGRGILRNPWLFAQAQDMLSGQYPRVVGADERGRFLLDYIDLLLTIRDHHPNAQQPCSSRAVPGATLSESSGEIDAVVETSAVAQPARGRERWVVNKLRALCAWYSRGVDNGARLRIAVNAAGSVPALRRVISDFFVLAPQDHATNS